MSKGERIAAITGIWVAVVLVMVLDAIWPWFRGAMGHLQWALGVASGWLLCSAVNRKR